jgi:uncharacterized delta-60 repeat protein
LELVLAQAAQGGSLDPTFGSNGKVITDLESNNQDLNALVLQPDGKLVAAGQRFLTFNGNSGDFVLVRYAPDGSLDLTFGTNGKVTTDFIGGHDELNALVLQPDGKLVAAGQSYFPLPVGANVDAIDFVLARYNLDGSFDPTFGTNGKVTMDFGSAYDQVKVFVLQPDGKMVAVGATFVDDAVGDFALACYNPDGSFDPTFGTDGKVIMDFADQYDFAEVFVLQFDGKLVVGGEVQVAWNLNFGLARYNSDGSFDTTFGTDGKVTMDFAGGHDNAYVFALQPDGKLVAVGMANSKPIPEQWDESYRTAIDFALARYNSDGSLDPTFGSDGKVVTDFAHDADVAFAIALQPDGKLVVAGAASVGGVESALTRYQSDGSLDARFGMQGKVTMDFAGGYDSIFVLVRQPDGRLATAGIAQVGDDFEFALGRYLGGPTASSGYWMVGVDGSVYAFGDA